jgi:hypothetical protein
VQDHNSLNISSVYVIPQHSTSYTKIFCVLILYTHLYFTVLIANLTRIVWLLNCGFILTFYNGNCSFILTTLTMATWGAETFQCIEITFMHSSAFVGHLKKNINKLIFCYALIIHNVRQNNTDKRVMFTKLWILNIPNI